MKERLKLDLQSLQLTRKWADELRSYRTDDHEFSNASEFEIIKRLTVKPNFIVSSGSARDYYEYFIKYGNEKLDEQEIDSLTLRLINGESSSISIIPLSLLGNAFVPVTCKALNLSELKINNRPKPKTVDGLIVRLVEAIRRSAKTTTKSFDACMTGFEKLLG